MRKNLDLSDETVRILTIEAVNKKTVFKHLAEKILAEEAKKIEKRKERL